jgi:hypothetical protein
MKKLNKIYFIVTITLIGGLGGFLYWKFFGCTDGTCALRSNWMIMTGYGLLIGYMIADFIPFKKREEIKK